MNHLPLIIKREYLAKVKNKSFILMTFLSPLILVGLLSLVAYLTSVNNEKVRTIAVLDESGFLSETLVSTDQMIYENLSDISLEAAKKLSNKKLFLKKAFLFLPITRKLVAYGYKNYWCWQLYSPTRGS